MVEINTVQQTLNVAATPIVQAAWAQGQPLAVHGLVYSPADGSLKVRSLYSDRIIT
jgi:carbonic anhydrase